MTGDVPPARQCVICERKAVDPTESDGLCSKHLAQTDAGEPDKSADAGQALPDQTATSNTKKIDSISPDHSAEVENEGRGGRAALEDAVFWFHSQLDHTINDHTDAGEHPERPTTAREYWEDIRGFAPGTVDNKLLGWARSNARTELIHHPRECGHDREAILGTGLFTEDLRLLWHGRYVIPYFDAGGRVAYAISRATGKRGGGVDYDGHPSDFMAKYAKLAHTKDYVDVDEPIYGLESIEDGEDVIITEGILDAITAHEAGYACLSPVTTTFKRRHREALLEILDEHDVERVYVVQDAEPPTSDVKEDTEGWDALRIEQFGEGVKGGAKTAGYLSENSIAARLAKLPRLGIDKLDLDDYLHGWADALGPVLASAVPPEQHPAYTPPQQDEAEVREQAIESARRQTESDKKNTQNGDSAYFYGVEYSARDQARPGSPCRYPPGVAEQAARWMRPGNRWLVRAGTTPVVIFQGRSG